MASSNTLTQQTKPERSLSPWQIARKKFLHNKLAMISTFFYLACNGIIICSTFSSAVFIANSGCIPGEHRFNEHSAKRRAYSWN